MNNSIGAILQFSGQKPEVVRLPDRDAYEIRYYAEYGLATGSKKTRMESMTVPADQYYPGMGLQQISQLNQQAMAQQQVQSYVGYGVYGGCGGAGGTGGYGSSANSAVNLIHQENLKIKEEKTTKKGGPLKALKDYMEAHKNIIFTLVLALLADHYVFNGAFRKKIEGIVNGLLDKAQKQIGSTHE